MKPPLSGGEGRGGEGRGGEGRGGEGRGGEGRGGEGRQSMYATPRTLVQPEQASPTGQNQAVTKAEQRYCYD